jgi:hypothetical protein
MSAGVPTFFDLSNDPFTLAVATTGTAIPVTTWDVADGATAILVVQVPADGQSVAIRGAASSVAVTAFPDTPLRKAKRDDASSINIVLTSPPIRYAAVGDIELVSSAAFNAVCCWLVVAEPGT